MSYRVALAHNSVSAEEIAAVNDVMTSGRMTQGERVAEFERQFALMLGVKHAIMVNSGSSANLVGLEALIQLSRAGGDQIADGDEAIIQGLNWPSTIKPLINLRVRPVFCDVELDSLNATVAHVEAVRTERTRLVVAVPVLGNPAHLDELEDYCAKTGLALFVDACESLGASTASDRKVGTQGRGSAFSFYFSHHLTTIEGGIIATSDDLLAEYCRAIRSHGWSRESPSGSSTANGDGVDPRFRFVLPGYNVRSTDVNAAIGSVQLARLSSSVLARRRIARGRLEALADLVDRVVVPGSADPPGHSWMAFPMLFDSRQRRDAARESLEQRGVETRPIIVGNVLRQPTAALFGLSPAQPALPACDRVFESGLMIGLDPAATADDEVWLQQALRSSVGATP